MKKQSVLLDWVSENLSWREQTVLLATVRGPDGMPKHNSGKVLCRLLRSHILQDATPGRGTFMNYDLRGDREEMEKFFNDHDGYPHHFIMHLIHAAQILGYKHPEKPIAMFWSEFYEKACDAMHMNPETEEEMSTRLADDV